MTHLLRNLLQNSSWNKENIKFSNTDFAQLVIFNVGKMTSHTRIGPSINDVTVLEGRGYQGFCDDSTKALVLNSVTIRVEGMSKIAWTTPIRVVLNQGAAEPLGAAKSSWGAANL